MSITVNLRYTGTIDMHDYGSFEKVGSLPKSLPRNDKQILGKGDITAVFSAVE